MTSSVGLVKEAGAELFDDDYADDSDAVDMNILERVNMSVPFLPF
jgi:hypothetical protein